MNFLNTAWKAFTYRNGKFSRSGFLRTVFNAQLIWAYGYVILTVVPVHGLTWELVVFSALCQGLLIADYRGLLSLRDLKPDSGMGGGWWGRRHERAPSTEGLEEGLEDLK